MKDKPEFYEKEDANNYYMRSPGTRKLAIVTQNVDALHQRAGSRDIVHLHGRGNQLKCMSCGKRVDR